MTALYSYARDAAGRQGAGSTGEMVWVHADQATMRSTPLPEALRERLA